MQTTRRGQRRDAGVHQPTLVAEMVKADYTAAKRDSLVKLAGFQAYDYNE